MANNISNANNTVYANENDEVFFSIVSHIGVLAEYQTGWKKEVNLVAWNGNPAKFDVRDWSPDHERMSRGITLHEEEARRLMDHLSRRFRGKPRMVHQQVANVEPAAAPKEETVVPEETMAPEEAVVTNEETAVSNDEAAEVVEEDGEMTA